MQFVESVYADAGANILWFDNVFIFKFISKFSIQRIFNMNGNNSKNNLCKCIRLPFSLETWMKMCRTNCMSFSTLTKHNMFRSTNEKKIEAFFSLFSSPLIVHWKKKLSTPFDCLTLFLEEYFMHFDQPLIHRKDRVFLHEID